MSDSVIQRGERRRTVPLLIQYSLSLSLSLIHILVSTRLDSPHLSLCPSSPAGVFASSKAEKAVLYRRRKKAGEAMRPKRTTSENARLATVTPEERAMWSPKRRESVARFERRQRHSGKHRAQPPPVTDVPTAAPLPVAVTSTVMDDDARSSSPSPERGAAASHRKRIYSRSPPLSSSAASVASPDAVPQLSDAAQPHKKQKKIDTTRNVDANHSLAVTFGCSEGVQEPKTAQDDGDDSEEDRTMEEDNQHDENKQRVQRRAVLPSTILRCDKTIHMLGMKIIALELRLQREDESATLPMSDGMEADAEQQENSGDSDEEEEEEEEEEDRESAVRRADRAEARVVRRDRTIRRLKKYVHSLRTSPR